MNWFTWNRIIRLLLRDRGIFSESFLPQYFTARVLIAVFWKKEKRNEENISLRRSDLFFNKIVPRQYSCWKESRNSRRCYCMHIVWTHLILTQIFRNNRNISLSLSLLFYLSIYFSFAKSVFLSRGQYFSQISLKQLFYFQPDLPTYLFRNLIWFIQKFIK